MTRATSNQPVADARRDGDRGCGVASRPGEGRAPAGRAGSEPTPGGGEAKQQPDSEAPQRGVAVVVNGNAKNVTREVITMLDQILRRTDLYVSRSLEDAAEIAKRVVESGYGTVLTGGGDGTFMVTVSEVVKAADAAGKPRPRFGYLKLGTGNALAHVVGATGARVLAADIRRLKEEAGSREIGLVEVGGMLTPFCGFGADAVVLQDYKRVKSALSKTPLKPFATGPLAYLVSAVGLTIPSYLLRSMPHCTVTNLGEDAFRLGRQGRVMGKPVQRGDVLYEGPAQIVGVSTIPYYGYGLRMFPFAEERNDRMNLRISTISPSAFARHAKSIWRGEYVNAAHVFDYLVQHIRIEMDPATAFQIGGDVVGERASMECKLTDEPVRLVDFYAPPSAMIEE
jgi:diacylglycerol kinase family enzyme